MRTVFVTGASGLIGSELCEALLTKGYKVIGVGETPTSSVDNPNFKFVQTSLDNKEAVTAAMMEQGIDVLIHAACTVDNDFPPMLSPAEEKKSAAVDKYLFKSAVQAGVNDMIMISTHQIYAQQKTREPIRETADEKPVTVYAKMKADTEKAMAKAIKSAVSAKGVIARVCPIYTKDFADNLHTKIFDPKDNICYIYGYGDYGFSFCCLYNLIDFIIGILSSPQGINYQGIYNVCDTRPISAKEIVEFERQYHRLGPVIQRNYGADAVKSAMSFSSKTAKIDYRYNDVSLACSNVSYDNTRAQRISTFRWKLSNTK